MANINVVLEGKFKNEKIKSFPDILYLPKVEFGYVIGKYQISSYTVIDETTKEEYSFWQGALGELLFGDMGAMLGIGGKQTKEYLISIKWYDGDKSLILIDDEYYKIFVRSMF
ncbi:MAG: hypothetical protein ACI4EJ_02930 [Bacteroides sp.]